MSEIVFILGAGASMEAGAPAMDGFLDTARSLHRNGKVPESASAFNKVFDGVAVPSKVVQERLGHKKIATTLDVYAHVLPSMQRDAASKLTVLLHGR